MSHGAPDPSHEDGSVYDGLLGGDPSQWAFGTDFEDPLAGVDTTVPAGLDAAELAAYCLFLGDDSLVMSHRLAEWCSNAPDLEDDIALANIALDLLGQARLLLSRAAAADPSLVPTLPEGSPVPAEDALAFFRDEAAFRNVRYVEAVNGDFAVTVARLLLFATHRLALLQRLTTSVDPVLAAIAAKGVKEVTYHRDYAGRWFLTLARGTGESRRRLVAGIDTLWPYWAELFDTHAVERETARAGVGVDPAGIAPDADAVLQQVLTASGVDRPALPPRAGTQGHTGRAGRTGHKGRDGDHTDALGGLLAEMQVVARAHPRGQW